MRTGLFLCVGESACTMFHVKQTHIIFGQAFMLVLRVVIGIVGLKRCTDHTYTLYLVIIGRHK